MQTINICEGLANASRLILGCMRMPALSTEEADRINLTHQEWYKLYLSSGKFLP